MDIHRLYKAAVLIDLDAKILKLVLELAQLKIQRNTVVATPIYPQGGLPIVGGEILLPNTKESK